MASPNRLNDTGAIGDPGSTLKGTPPRCTTRVAGEKGVSDVYVTAGPGAPEAVYERVAMELRARRASIVRETLVVCGGKRPAAAAIAARRANLAELDDVIAPTILLDACPFATGVTVAVHAVAGAEVRPVGFDLSARLCEYGTRRWLFAGAMTAVGDDGPSQSSRVLRRAQTTLRRAGANFADLACLWTYLDRLPDWHGEYDKVRTALLEEQGASVAPATVVVGVRPAGGAVCVADVVAAWGEGGMVEPHESAGGLCRSAGGWRAVTVRMPGGSTVLVSGTGAVDANDHVRHVDDVDAQIRLAVENVRAVLRERGCDDAAVVSAVAWCATPRVRRRFEEKWRKRTGWPVFCVVGDLRRREMLIEIEARACAGAR